MVNTDVVYNCVKIITDTDNNILRYIIKNTSTGVEFEFDESMINTWKESGKKIVMFDTESTVNLNIREKNLLLSERLQTLAEYMVSIDGSCIVDYTSIRQSVIAGANSGFTDIKEIYMSNQGVYKHFDGCTTVIDIDGFYSSDMGGYRNVIDAIHYLAEDIKKCADGLKEPIHGINNKEFNLDKLLEISSNNLLDLLHERIVPVTISCKTDKGGEHRNLNKVVYLKPVYLYDDLITDLKVIYREAREMAIKCTK